MENVKIQMVVTLEQPISYLINTQTIQLYKKLIAKVTKLQFIRLRKYLNASPSKCSMYIQCSDEFYEEKNEKQAKNQMTKKNP